MKIKIAFITCLLTILLAPLNAAAGSHIPQWDLDLLSKKPKYVETNVAMADGVQSLFIDGVPYQGRPTKFFAYLGFPKNVKGKVPAVVLVHGGGGTAFADWVKYWNAKGYAALAMDSEGQVPINSTEAKGKWKTIDSLSLPWSGGPQGGGPFGDDQAPIKDKWFYHGVANCLISVSLLGSFPEIDASRIGIVGISMGSVLCSTAGGIDDRLAFVVPQYIGGNLYLGNVWYDYMKNNPETYLLDPANFYANSKTRAHWLWINGINDKYGLPPMTNASFKMTSPNSWMTILPTLGHAHMWGEVGKNAVREIYAFADNITKGSPPLAKIVHTALGDGEVTLTWVADLPIVRARICYTNVPIPLIDIANEWRNDWEAVSYMVKDMPLPTVIPQQDRSNRATFMLPEDMMAGIINLIDTRGLSVSSEFLYFSRLSNLRD